MTLPFYDNHSEPDPERPGFVRVERVYCLDWHRFGEPQWRALADVYSRLPGWLQADPFGRWFGDENNPPYVWASVEPSGLQVWAVLPEADWRAWDEQFRAEAGHLPSFDVG